jgi:hypothetical protein
MYVCLSCPNVYLRLILDFWAFRTKGSHKFLYSCSVFFCIWADLHSIRQMSISDGIIPFLFPSVSVNGSKYKSIVHKLYILNTASIIMLQNFMNYLRFFRNRKSKLKGFFFFALSVFLFIPTGRLESTKITKISFKNLPGQEQTLHIQEHWFL